jgi:hypothetical protein
MNRIASAVMCFNRPAYLEKTLDSFLHARGMDKIDWFMFQDGAYNQVSGKTYARDAGINLVREVVGLMKFPFKEKYFNEFNLGPAQQRYIIYKTLFNKGYKTVFVFDDDMIVGEDYLILLEKMRGQFPNYVGILYTNKTNKKPTIKNLQSLKVMRTARLWGHYMTKENWEKIKPKYTIYYNHIKKYDYREERGKARHALPNGIPVIGDDTIINHLCREQDIKKLVPLISRAKYIGKNGSISYKTEKTWKGKEMHKQRDQIIFKQDKHLERFKIK